MKYMKRSKMYKASNVNFNPEANEAYSYSWWRFVKVIDGLVVFNKYRYSVSTARHQSKVRQLMSELGIKIDLVVCTRKSLSSQTLEDLIVTTEEGLCNAWLLSKERNIKAYERIKAKRPSKMERTINKVIENSLNSENNTQVI